MEMWWQGFQIAVEGNNLLFLLIGTVVGLIIGALPGLGPLFAVALMMPLTYGMPPATAIIMLAAVHAACAYGDSLASILVNVPGGVGSVASCWDGFPLAKKGKAALALGISAGGSFFGGIVGWLSLVLISPFLMEIALKMGPAEYFMLAILALSLLSMASHGKAIQSLILGGFGMLLAFVGSAPITALQRMTFGVSFLEDGLPLVPVTVGIFALSQAMVLAEKSGTVAEVREMVGSVWEGVLSIFRMPLTLIRGGIVGILLGIMPALGLSSANVVAYMAERRSSKDPDSFGKGNPAGLLAPEVAKNACIVGDLIPTFTLGIPGSSTTALFLAAMILHGIQPGASFFRSGPLPYAIFVGILVSQFAFVILGLLFARYFARVVFVPNSILVPIITVLCFVGAFAMRNSIMDVLLTIVFGVIGYLLTKSNWPAATFVLGFVLAEMAESNFHRAMLITGGSFIGLVSSPISILLAVGIVILLAWPIFGSLLQRTKRQATA